MKDLGKVSKPHHYSQGKIETIEHIEDMVDDPTSYRIGNAIKYLARWKYKNGHKDLLKVIWYVSRELVEAGFGEEVVSVVKQVNERKNGKEQSSTDAGRGDSPSPSYLYSD